MRIGLFLLATLVTTPAAHAWEHAGQFWFQGVTQGRLAPGVLAFAELQPRLGFKDSAGSYLISRAAVGTPLAGALSGWLGMAWVPQFRPAYRSELRPFTQLLYPHNFGSVATLLRGRYEMRFFENDERPVHRARLLVRTEFRPGTEAPGNYSFWPTVSAELFASFNRRYDALDQVRGFAGVTFKVDKMTFLDVGDLTQLLFPSGGAKRWNHTLALSLVHNFDLAAQ